MKARTVAIRTYVAMLVLFVFLLGVFVTGDKLTERFTTFLTGA